MMNSTSSCASVHPPSPKLKRAWSSFLPLISTNNPNLISLNRPYPDPGPYIHDRIYDPVDRDLSLLAGARHRRQKIDLCDAKLQERGLPSLLLANSTYSDERLDPSRGPARRRQSLWLLTSRATVGLALDTVALPAVRDMPGKRSGLNQNAGVLLGQELLPKIRLLKPGRRGTRREPMLRPLVHIAASSRLSLPSCGSPSCALGCAAAGLCLCLCLCLCVSASCFRK